MALSTLDLHLPHSPWDTLSESLSEEEFLWGNSGSSPSADSYCAFSSVHFWSGWKIWSDVRPPSEKNMWMNRKTRNHSFLLQTPLKLFSFLKKFKRQATPWNCWQNPNRLRAQKDAKKTHTTSYKPVLHTFLLNHHIFLLNQNIF